MEALVRDVENQVVEIVAVGCIVPTDQTLVNAINITSKIRKGLSNLFNLWDVGKNFWVRAEIDVLTVAFRLWHDFRVRRML
jgi:hypothetical protein